MDVILNGERRELPDGATVAQAVQVLTAAMRGVAVAVNDEVVARGDWAARTLSQGDRIEVLTAVQGG